VLVWLVLQVAGNGAFAAIPGDTDSLAFVRQKHADTTVVLYADKESSIPLRSYATSRQLNLCMMPSPDLVKAIDSCWSWYGITRIISTTPQISEKELGLLCDTTPGYSQIFVHMDIGATGIPPLLNTLPSRFPSPALLVAIVYGDPQQNHLDALHGYDVVILAGEPLASSVAAVVKGIFGGIPFRGKTAKGAGIVTRKTRLHYGSSLEAGIPPERFLAIDTIVQQAMDSGAFPGCQVMAIWKGNVIFEKAYGYHTYDKTTPVKITDLYDLASVTKVLATTAALMHLEDQDRLNTNKRLGHYLSIAKDTEYEDLRLRAILSHNAGLVAWIPFYRSLIKEGIPDSTVFRKTASFDFPIRVADSLFIHKSYADTMLRIILNTPLNPKPEYLYSDLGMILLKYAIEEQTKTPFEEYLETNIYQPLNLFSIGYNPLDAFPAERIVPTENDRYFRMSLLHGYVHDPAAAMLGGVAGHAGLFSDARDAAVIMYTLINKGRYGAASLFSPSVIDDFNERHYRDVRRGLGFDKPDPVEGNKPSVTPMASDRSFGHSGFTGTYVWADPEHELVFVFLSNRVHPTQDNGLLTSLGIRMKIHEVLYRAIMTEGQ